jgi:hypothetical protein
VDSDADSVAWRLVERHGAGVRMAENDPMGGLRALFDDPNVWNRMAQGARNLALREFNLDTNMCRLQDAFQEVICGKKEHERATV